MNGFQVQVFDITLEKEVYREGENVVGLLTVINEEEIKIKSLRLDICGVAVIYWDSVGIDSDIDPVEKMKGDCSRDVFFSKSITLIHKEGGLLDKQLSVLSSGSHQYPFEVKLPQDLPSSFEGGKLGKIRFLAKGTIHRPRKTCIITRKVFTVKSGLDLNFLPEAAVKIELCKQKELGSLCCKKGSVTVDWCVGSSGFVPGQDICITGAIQNESQETVSCSKVTLLQVIDYRSNKRHKQQKCPLVTVDRGITEPSGVTVWQENLLIPPLTPTGLSRCKLIDVSYELQFTACFVGKLNPINFTKPIYIGTIPICYQEMKSCVAGMYRQPYHDSPTEEEAYLIGGDEESTMQQYQQQQQQVEYQQQQQGFPSASSTISLTKIIQAVYKTSPRTNPSAPRLDSRENLADEERRLCDAEKIQTSEERPPPYAPGHCSTDNHKTTTAPTTLSQDNQDRNADSIISETEPLIDKKTERQTDEVPSLYPTLSSGWTEGVQPTPDDHTTIAPRDSCPTPGTSTEQPHSNTDHPTTTTTPAETTSPTTNASTGPSEDSLQSEEASGEAEEQSRSNEDDAYGVELCDGPCETGGSSTPKASSSQGCAGDGEQSSVLNGDMSAPKENGDEEPGTSESNEDSESSKDDSSASTVFPDTSGADIEAIIQSKLQTPPSSPTVPETESNSTSGRQLIAVAE